MADGMKPGSLGLQDRFGRQVTYLRLSATDRCDMRCTYCMAENMQFLPKRDLLSTDEMVRICDAFIARGVRKIRVTGGEPLVRRDVMDLFETLGERLGSGLSELTLTTNGSQLARHAGGLRKAGVRRVNVSLDAIDPARFKAITRRGDIDQVLAGLRAAREAGLKIKINTVALKDQNADHLAEMIRWAHGEGFDMTLIEVMPMGDAGADRSDQYLPLLGVRRDLESFWHLEELPQSNADAGPSRYVRVRETGGKLGFITPLTNNFCSGCNRMRVTCTGRIYMCLGQDDHVDLRTALRDSPDPDAALGDCLDRALGAKPEKHEFEIRSPGAAPTLSRHMSVTGG
ncbi:MAG: GTP 3',8-cyclase MoaA [Pseudomonadota bacterium]